MRLIKHDGKVRKTEHRGEGGRVEGVTIEHKDGRKDYVARPDTHRLKLRVED